jgi:hypothetical protein
MTTSEVFHQAAQARLRRTPQEQREAREAALKRNAAATDADYCPSLENGHRHRWQYGEATRQCTLCHWTEDLPR